MSSLSLSLNSLSLLRVLSTGSREWGQPLTQVGSLRCYLLLETHLGGVLLSILSGGCLHGLADAHAHYWLAPNWLNQTSSKAQTALVVLNRLSCHLWRFWLKLLGRGRWRRRRHSSSRWRWWWRRRRRCFALFICFWVLWYSWCWYDVGYFGFWWIFRYFWRFFWDFVIANIV